MLFRSARFGIIALKFGHKIVNGQRLDRINDDLVPANGDVVRIVVRKVTAGYEQELA